MSGLRQFEPMWGVWRVDGRPLGEGSFGTVYRVVREEYGKKYYAAVKHLSIPASDSQIADAISEGVASDIPSVRGYFDSIAQNLIKEITMMSQVKGHTNIVSYEDHLIIPKATGIGYDILIRMELLTGLNDVLFRRQLTGSDVIKLGIDICSALEVCVEKGIVHRDIKPSNIFVNDIGDYKLGDFGVARELEQTTVGMSKKGTYSYMAPEVYRGEPANFTADTFSLGIVMYRLLNGNRAPFLSANAGSIKSGDNEAALARRMSGEPLPPPAFADSALAAVILRATQFDKSKRFANPTEFKKALQNVRDGVPTGWSVPYYEDFVDNGWSFSSDNPDMTQTAAVSGYPDAGSTVAAESTVAADVAPAAGKAKKRGRLIAVIAAVVAIAAGLAAFIGLTQEGERPDEILIGGQVIRTNVTELFLNDMDITDISDLKYCQDLVYLDLSNNQITDIEAIGKLKKLTYLSISDNYFTSVRPLARCTNLEYLNITDVAVEDLTPLAKLSKLERIDLSCDDLSDIECLTNTRFLGLFQNGQWQKEVFAEAELSHFAGLKNLENLQLTGYIIRDFSPLEELPQLAGIHMTGCRFGDIDSLCRLTQLERLEINYCGLSEEQTKEIAGALSGCEVIFAG